MNTGDHVNNTSPARSCTGTARVDSDQQPDHAIDGAVRSRVIEELLKHLNEKYVYPEVAERMETSIRGNYQKGEYDSITSATAFAETLEIHLQEVSHDKHLRVRFSHEPLPEANEAQEPDPQQRADHLSRLKARNFGFEKVARLDGNIGYLKFNVFVSPELGGETAVAAMNFLANTDALIIDLRHNNGGDPAMVALISSYLFDPEPIHLNSLYWRPADKTHQWWTLPLIPGRRFGTDKTAFVLTSSRTFSAAEEFAYNLQNLKRATIVGEVTGGGAHPGGNLRIDEHFSVWVPSGRAVNPISGTNWEGTGVKPDVEVSADLSLKTAHLAALRVVLEQSVDVGLVNEIRSSIEKMEEELA